MSTPRPSFQSARIHYRAIRLTDTAIFDLLVNDVPGFANTTFANAKPPSPDEAEKFLKETTEDALLAYRGYGYGSEAIRWAMDYAFRRAGLHSMRMRAFGWNMGAIRLYEKLGFIMEGREREAVWFEGRWWDSVTLGMLEDEWRGLQMRGVV
ncbi:acetyltransferase [Pyrenophora tritici-repentis]|nr:acetyltransferase [Pyrenophora tritici-repentis]KAF7452652.1 acetyltransferase [Pyrenophora tritici-repentis]KAG9386981.1 acetyltransferase [Pyrenophora tritici-repentis]KAI0578397.1 acetyltransferase [Pyrenophora tritici-repentis]KAI1528321.1 acetyltransferase [Pyrenophora tritici-repentis]